MPKPTTPAPAAEEPAELVVNDEIASALRAAGEDPLAAAEAVNYHRAYAGPHPIIEPEAEAE